MKRVLLVIILIYISSLIYSQTNKQFEDTMKLGEEIINKKEYFQALKLYNRLLINAEKQNKVKQKEQLIDAIGKTYENMEKYDKALEYYHKLLDIYVNKKDLKNQIRIYRKLGNLNFFLFNFYLAIEYYQKSLQIAEEIKDDLSIAKSYNNIGAIFTQWNNIDSALGYYKKANNHFIKLKQDNEIAMGLSNIADLYIRKKDYNQAMQYCDEALKIALNSNSQIQIAKIYYYKARIYSILKQNNQAFDYYNKSISLMLELKYNESAAIIMLEIAKTYLHNNNLDKANFYLNKSLNISLLNNYKYILNENYKARYKLYDSLGDFIRAYKFLKLYNELNDSLVNSEREKQISINQSKYDSYRQIEKLNREKLSTEFKLTKQKIVIYVSIFILFMLLFLSFLLLRQLSFRKKLNEEVNNKLILEAELNKIRNEQLQNQISKKDRELTAASLNLSYKSDLLINIKEKLIKIIPELNNPELSPKLKEIDHLINNAIKLNEDWNKFKLHFEEIHTDFFVRLKRDFPEISNNDLKHCAYIKINLTNKEIARMLNISLNGVNVARKRLKKKLKLGMETSLTAFIQNF